MERQTAKTLDGIRRDHIARYEWVSKILPDQTEVIDVACGVGYGSNIMAEAGHSVVGFDISPEAIEYAKEFWPHPRAVFSVKDMNEMGEISGGFTAVAFECIEHVEDPRPALVNLRNCADGLIASVPNEDVYPWIQGIPFHYRHYTKGQFESLLNQCGWHVDEWYGQDGAESEVEQDINGRTLIAKCSPGENIKQFVLNSPLETPADAPEHVSILALGPSISGYTNVTKSLGGRHRYCDEVWAVNAMGAVMQCDRVFHMDDVRIQEIRAEANPESNIAVMLKWLKTSPVPVVTSRAHPDYPAMEEFPLEAVLNRYDYGYFNSTVAYAVAYAIFIGVKKLSLFGVDFTYPNAHDAEKGRACVEFWLGIAAAQGIKLTVPANSTLLDAIHTDRDRFYGYDTLDLDITQDDTGLIRVMFTERKDLPTAAEIELAYNHDTHPNALMVEEKDEIQS